MLASSMLRGGAPSGLRPHHLSITLIARCIAKYRSPETFPCFGAGVYTVHTHSSLPSPLLSSYRTPRCSMMHPASAPRAIHEILNRRVTGVDEVFCRNQKILPKKRYTMPPIRATRLRSENTEIPGMARPGEAIKTIKKSHSERVEWIFSRG
jgi:hypothetical protein